MLHPGMPSTQCEGTYKGSTADGVTSLQNIRSSYKDTEGVEHSLEFIGSAVSYRDPSSSPLRRSPSIIESCQQGPPKVASVQQAFTSNGE